MITVNSVALQIRAEQKACHLAAPPPIDERISYTIMTLRDMDFGRQKSVYGCKF